MMIESIILELLLHSVILALRQFSNKYNKTKQNNMLSSAKTTLSSSVLVSRSTSSPTKLNQSQHHDLLLIENKYTK